MNDPARRLGCTFDEYIELEQSSDIRYEFLNGEVYAMAGASPERSLIVSNVNHAMGVSLDKRPCMTFDGSLRIRVLASGLAAHPDVTIACNPLEWDPENEDTIANPVVLVEVLSPSTEDYDRVAKFFHYKRIPSLRDYLRISQNEKLVEHCVRNEDGSWTVRDVRPPEDVVLASLGIKLSLDAVYAQVFELKASRPAKPIKTKRKRRLS